MKQNLISLPNKIAHHRFKKVIFDIETEGLEGNTIHCIVAKVIGGETYLFPPDKLQEGADLIESADVLIGHNIIGFDIPVLKKHFNLNLTNHIEDTLVVSRLVNPVLTGGHSLENWGYILYPNEADKRKAQQPDSWENYTEEMGKYCIQDVELNADVYYKLLEQVENFSQESVDLEHSVAKIMKEQEINGFMLDEQKATMLAAKLNSKMAEIEKKVHETFKPKWVDDKIVTPKIRKDGTLSKVGLTNEEMRKCLRANNFKPFMRQKWVTFNLASRKQIGEYLIDFGWNPERFTPTGQPIVDEKTLSEVTHIREAKLIADFLLIQKRIAQVDSWVSSVRDDGRVHGFVIPNGAITGRMTHRNPNMAQVPSVHSPYGKECRSCWVVDEGNVLLGVDASGLELRMLAHYMNDDKYTNEILNGDIHSANQKSAGLQTRDQAKTFIYAFLYGAGDVKIGEVAGGGAKRGRHLKKNFLNNTPALKQLREKVSESSGKGWVTGLDGRKLHIRSQHSALNTLLQSAGAVIMKKALVLLDSYARQYDLDYKFVLNVHDEFQCEVRQDQADFFGGLAVGSIIQAGKSFKLNCPLDGEYKVGETWQQTH